MVSTARAKHESRRAAESSTAQQSSGAAEGSSGVNSGDAAPVHASGDLGAEGARCLGASVAHSALGRHDAPLAAAVALPEEDTQPRLALLLPSEKMAKRLANLGRADLLLALDQFVLDRGFELLRDVGRRQIALRWLALEGVLISYRKGTRLGGGPSEDGFLQASGLCMPGGNVRFDPVSTRGERRASAPRRAAHCAQQAGRAGRVDCRLMRGKSVPVSECGAS